MSTGKVKAYQEDNILGLGWKIKPTIREILGLLRGRFGLLGKRKCLLGWKSGLLGKILGECLFFHFFLFT